MKNLKSVKKIRLTRDQDDLMSRVADSLRKEDQVATKGTWGHLIQSLDKPTPRVSESDLNHLIWQAISRAHLAADITESSSTDDIEDYIKEVEEKLKSVGDDAELANVNLQNMLQKQQQTFQMVSNISKMLYDPALSVIRRIGGWHKETAEPTGSVTPFMVAIPMKNGAAQPLVPADADVGQGW